MFDPELGKEYEYSNDLSSDDDDNDDDDDGEEKDEKVSITFSSLPVVEGDMMQYRQLFKNLFENAIRS